MTFCSDISNIAVRTTRRTWRKRRCIPRPRKGGRYDAVADLYALCQLSTADGGVTGNHARGRRGQSEKAVLRQCCPRLPVELKLSLYCFGVFPHPGSESLARQRTSIQANRKACGENLNSSPVPEGLYHGKLLKSVTSAELGPIQNFCAPYVGSIQNLEPMLSGVLFETVGDDLLDLVATAKAVGRVRNFLECRQLEQVAQCRKMCHGQRQVTICRVVNSVRRRQVGVRIAECTPPRRPSPVIQVCGEHFKLEIQ